MPVPPLPTEITQPARLAAVDRSGLLDSAPDAAFDRLAGLAARLLHAPFAFVTIVDERRSYWKASVGLGALSTEDRQNPVEESFCQYVIQTQGAFVIGDTAADQRTRENPSVAKMGVAAWAGFPLMSPDGQALGSFCVMDTKVRDWTDDDVDVLRTLADAAGAEIALIEALAEERAARAQAAEALDRERRALIRAEALMRAGVALGERNDAISVLRAVVGATVPGIGVWCTVHLRRQGLPPELVAVGHRDQVLEAELRALDGDPDPWLRTRIATPVVLFDRPQNFVLDGDDEAAARLGADEIVSLPLRVRGTTIGALTVGLDPEEHRDMASTLAGLAGQAAVALDNAALYDEQAEVARILQHALLPGNLPDVPGAELAVRFRPAGANVQVGGDFYDVFSSTMRTDHGFVVGDVAGKGASAATLTSVVRHTLRAAFVHGDGPRQAVALANDALFEVAGSDRFCTAIYGQFEVADGRILVELVRAGHPVAYVIRANGPVEALDPDGGIIGYQLDRAWDSARVQLTPGDALVVYTDGAIELPQRTGVDGEQALRDLLPQLAGHDAQEIVEAIEHQTLVLSDGPLRDDLALLVIRCPSMD